MHAHTSDSIHFDLPRKMWHFLFKRHDSKLVKSD